MVGSATLTIVVSRLIASTAAQTVSRMASLARHGEPPDELMWTVTTSTVAMECSHCQHRVMMGRAREHLPPRQPARRPGRGGCRAGPGPGARRRGAARGGAPYRRLAQRGLPPLRRPRRAARRDRRRWAMERLEQAMQRRARRGAITETDPARAAGHAACRRGVRTSSSPLAEPGLFKVAFAATDADGGARRAEEAASARPLRPARPGARRARRGRRRSRPSGRAGRGRGLLVGRARVRRSCTSTARCATCRPRSGTRPSRSCSTTSRAVWPEPRSGQDSAARGTPPSPPTGALDLDLAAEEAGRGPQCQEDRADEEHGRARRNRPRWRRPGSPSPASRPRGSAAARRPAGRPR